MKRLMKFGVILIALAVALAGCRTATGSSEAQKMTVNIGITDGTTELKAPVAIKGADFNAIKAKLVAELGLAEVDGKYEFTNDGTTYIVNISGFYSNKEANSIIENSEVKHGDTIYAKADKKPVTVRVVENLNLKHEFTLPNTDVATVKAGITAELNKFKTPGSPIPEDLTFNGISGYVFESGKYYSIGGTIALTDEQLLEVIKKGGIIIIRTDKL